MRLSQITMPVKIQKSAIAVYNPSCPWERAIQNAAKEITGNWLPFYPCQMLAKTVMSLQDSDEWIENKELMNLRASYLFAPYMSSNIQTVVFVTHVLFLRDILENQEINNQLHFPVGLMSTPIAHFLFRSSPVHIHIDKNVLISNNKKVDFLHVGGFIISEQCLNIKNAIVDVKYILSDKRINDTVYDIKREYNLLETKTASRIWKNDFGEEVFFTSGHSATWNPDDKVLDKTSKELAKIIEIEPDDNGFVYVKYTNGNVDSVLKKDFDQRYLVV